MKKIISVILVAVCLCCVFTACDLNTVIETFTSGGSDVEYELTETSAIVVEVADKASVTEIVIPDEYEGLPVTEIAQFSISNLRFVEKITIGKNVEKIGNWCLRNNSKLIDIEVSEENENFASADGVLFTKDMKTVLAYPTAREGSYAIPEGVETIGTKAFYRCSSLTGITLPESVTSIEEKAFFRCSLESLTLPRSLEVIGKDAFAYCSAVKQVTIPSSVKEIADYAFYSCTSLLEIKVLPEKESLTLGEKWYPTNNGVEIKELKIVWSE